MQKMPSNLRTSRTHVKHVADW